MREKKAGNNAFVNYVKSSGIMQACPVAISSADTRVEEKFSQSFHDVSIFQRQYLTLFKNAIVILTNFRDVRGPMGINKSDNSFFNENKRGCRLAWSRLVDLGSIDSGSNPGSPTTSALPNRAEVAKTTCIFIFSKKEMTQ